MLPLCTSLPSTPALLDDAVALFESALNMAHTTATIIREVTYRPGRTKNTYLPTPTSYPCDHVAERRRQTCA
jgi:hypothetical protein